MDVRRTAIIMVHAFVGWALCAATMGIGQATTTMQNALVIHAVTAPVFFAGVAFVYFRRFNFTTPLQTAIAFVSFVMIMDLVLVALLILRSLAMFTSPLGTWIPFALIFLSTWATGAMVTRGGHSRVDPASAP